MRRGLGSIIALTLLSGGCATESDLKQLKSQISEVQDQVAELRRLASSKDEVQQINDRVVKQTERLQKSNSEMTVKVGEIDDKLQNTLGVVEQTGYKLDRLVQQVTQMQRDLAEVKASRAVAPPPPAGATGEVVNVPAPPPSRPDPLETYQSAYRDYQKGNFELAIQGFRDFVRDNPSSELADNAAYWVGESLFSTKKHREAVAQFDVVINKFPRSDKVPASLLKKGYSYIELGEKAQGIVQLQYVVHEHPASAEASLARQKLKALGIDTK